MSKLKKKVISSALIIIVLALASFGSYFISSGMYSSYPNIANLLNLQININNRILDVSLVCLILLWLITLFFFIFGLKNIFIIKKEKNIKETYIKIKERHGKSSTELDTFYEVIKSHKKMKLEELSNTFKIDEARTLEWAKILENNNLVDIQYPAFSKPFIELKEKKTEA